MWLLSLAIGLGVVFAALTASVIAERSAVKRFDERVLRAVARRRSDFLDGALGPLSMLATAEPLTLQALIAFTMILFTLDGNPPLHFAVAAIGCGILSTFVKAVVKRPRPAIPHLIRWLRSSSYPSGDLLTAASIYLTLAVIVAPHLPDVAARVAVFAIVATVLSLLAVCRVYVGVHHPSDVSAGILLGSAWALLVAAGFGYG